MSPNYVDQIKLANREIFTLYELARDFSASLSVQETLSLFTNKIRDFVPFDTCAIYLLDEKAGSAKSVHAEGKHRAVFLGNEIGIGEGVTGKALETRRAQQNFDPSLDMRVLRPGLDPNYSCMVSVPLLADEKLIGAVSLYSIGLSNYVEEHLRLLETISRIAADAISKSLRQAEAEIYALTDPMTGLPNARSLQIQDRKSVV